MAQNFVVTGAASGIGAELARQLLARGDRLVACDVNLAGMEPLRAVAQSPEQLRIERLDVRDAQAWQTLIDGVITDWGFIDVLANVAGVLRDNWVHETPADDVHFHIDINVKGVIFGTQAVINHMLARGQGHIINIASLAGIAPVPGLALYSASKFAVRGYSLAAGMELRERGIAVTAVCPDAVQTPMLDIQKDREQTALTFSGARALSAEEVVAAILGPVLRKRPLELTLPTSRGITSKLAGLLPNQIAAFVGSFRKAGLKRQQAIRAGKASTAK